jgi:hypothetical protein
MNPKSDQTRGSPDATAPVSGGHNPPTDIKADAAAAKDAILSETESAKHKAAKAREDIQAEAKALGDKAREEAGKRADDLKRGAASGLEDFADVIKNAGKNLEDKDQTAAARIVRSAADGLEGLSRSLSTSSVDDMVSEVRSFGRRNPTAFIAGAVLAGLAIGRFARASDRRNEDDRESKTTGPDWSNRQQMGGE